MAGLSREDITKAPPLYEQVYQSLRRALLQGRFEPGARLTESRLAEELGVSRTPIREALRQLQHDGLLVADEQGRISVPAPDLQDIVELYECRMALETLAARRAALHADEAALAAMDGALQEADRALAAGDPVEALAHNTTFHDWLARAGGNRRLADLLAEVRTHIVYVRAMVIQGSAMATEVRREHREILDCLRRRDPEAAADAVRRHLEADLQRFMQGVGRRESAAARGHG
ncbi:MAG TPA: GntR family transcriptional regulator [Limnochordales bacterium]